MSDLQRDLRKALETRAVRDTAHEVSHADRVWRIVQIIASQEGHCDLTVLVSASYLHDLVTFPKDHPQRHLASQRSAIAAESILKELRLTPNQIANTQHAIKAHAYSANIAPETIEAKILQDADRIEALGAIGIARCFAVSGALGRPLFDPDDPFAQQRPLDDSRFAADHFALKLLKLPGTMHTKAGTALAVERVNVMRDYLHQLADELGKSPPDW